MGTPLGEIVVRAAKAEDRPAIQAVVQDLPEWFDSRALAVSIPTDIRWQQVLVAETAGRIVGFVSLYVAEGRLNIGWIGVLRHLHRRGIGSRLLAEAERQARAKGIEQLGVMTLGDGVAYPPYEQTRAFYAKHGFLVRQRSRTDNAGCPEELHLVKCL